MLLKKPIESEQISIKKKAPPKEDFFDSNTVFLRHLYVYLPYGKRK